MKKTLKAMIRAVLMLMLLMSISTSVMADEGANIPGYNTTANNTTDMTKFTFVKTFDLLGDTTNYDFPNENFTIHFERYSVNGLPTGSTTTVSNMPVIPSATITAASIKDAPLQQKNGKSFKRMPEDVYLPTYTETGDYWYKVTETVVDENGSTVDVAGVIHDPNIYYLHVQVVKDSNNFDNLARLVTLHKPDPDDPTTHINAKTDGVTNIYGNGDIVIKKVVNGTVADPSQSYKIKVKMASTANVSSDITYKFFDNATNTQVGANVVIPHSAWVKVAGVDTLTQEIEITANKRVEFYNIPYGVTYTVQEEDYSSDFALPVYNIDTVSMEESDDSIVGAHSAVWTDKYVSGKITDAKDIITVINTMDASIDVGVIIDNMPYIVIILFVIGIIVVFAATRHKKEIVD